ncbi:MAG: heme/copper-type cytochrome/quinol oxidase subunit 1 [Planctomycetota bacterium]|jgi:heme/copper-type cytochrome/quinol oxidase subunit 1
MPPLARRFLKTAIAMGILAVLTGMHMASALHLGHGQMHRYYASAHTHLMLVGSAMMVCMGLAIWKLPQAPAGSRHRPGLDVLAYWLVTICSLGRFTFECWVGYLNPEPAWMHQVIHASSFVQGLGLILFMVNQWPRISGPAN